MDAAPYNGSIVSRACPFGLTLFRIRIGRKEGGYSFVFATIRENDF